MRDVEGLRVLVTGGASGIGAATVLEFRRRGARVGVLDAAISADTVGDLVARADVRSRADVDDAVARVVDEFGGLDIVVNNTGVSAVGTIDRVDDDEWARVLDINVTGMARVASAALPELRRSEFGAIVNVCSIAARHGLPQRALYSASKGAVLALTFALATDLVADGVRVNCVSPGTVHTAFVDRLLAGFPDPDAERAAMDARQAIGRMIAPDEVARAIAFLSAREAAGITGTELVVDGGFSNLRPRPTQRVGSAR